MANTIPNIIIQPDTITDIYADPGVIAAGVSIGDKISVAIDGQGFASLYSGPSAPVKIDDSTGYMPIMANETMENDFGDSGAYIYSLLGCTIIIGAL